MNVYALTRSDETMAIAATLETAKEQAQQTHRKPIEWTEREPMAGLRYWTEPAFEFEIWEYPLLWTVGDPAVPTLIAAGMLLELPEIPQIPTVKVVGVELRRTKGQVSNIIIEAEAV